MEMSGQDILEKLTLCITERKSTRHLWNIRMVLKNRQRKVQKITSKEQSALLRMNINMWPCCGVSQEVCMDPILKSSQAVNVLAEAGACCGTQMLWSPH